MSLILKQVHKSFGTPPTGVLWDISLTIQPGEFVSLIGKSGSGKSTLLYIMSSLDTPTSGEVLMAGENIHRMPGAKLHQFRNQKMGFVFQFHYLLPELTALENVLMPARKCHQHLQRTEYALHLLNEFGLREKAHRLPRQLSGGEQQRVAIARSLIMDPPYLFTDEPTGNLDSANGEKVMAIFQKMNRENKTTIILVTHDPDFAEMATRKIYLADGKLI